MPFPYLYDPTGLLPANAISNELHHVAPPVDLDRANFIVPRAAPYFATGLVIRTGVTVGSPALVEGVDYIYTHHFVEASQHLSTPVYGSIMFLNRAYVGDVYVSYHTLGGAYTLDDYGVVETLTRSLYNIRTVTWDQILGVPVAFPVVPHPHDVADLTGMAEVVTALTNIITAIQGNAGNIGSLMSTLINHIDGISSHNKSQVGLSYLENYAMAGTPELTTRPNNKYVSPAWVWQAIELFNLGEAGVSQASDTVVGITRYATDVEVADQDNPLDNVAVSAAGMWLAIATNTERLAGATIVTGVDFNTPPYREDGCWAFTNAINTSITPSSGYISTKKAGTKAYQTETLDNGEISNRMYTGTAWTPWVRAYVATYYGSMPVNILAGNVDLNDYTTPGFYTFDTHNIIGHAPPSFGVPSLHEMTIYASDLEVHTRCQVVLNLTLGFGAIRRFTTSGAPYFNQWVIISNITGLADYTTTGITSPGVWLVKTADFKILNVLADPLTSVITTIKEHPTIDVTSIIDTGYGTVIPSLVTQLSDQGGYGYTPRTYIRFRRSDVLVNWHLDPNILRVFTLADNNTNTPPNVVANRVYLSGVYVLSLDTETVTVRIPGFEVHGNLDFHLELYGCRVSEIATGKHYFSANTQRGIMCDWVDLALVTNVTTTTIDDPDTLEPTGYYTCREVLTGSIYTSRGVRYYTTTYSDGIYQRKKAGSISTWDDGTEPLAPYSGEHSSGVYDRFKPTSTGIWGPWLHHSY